MAIGFYDYDIYIKPNKTLLNLEAMKIANYYNNKNKSVILVDNLNDIENFEKFFIFRNVLDKNTDAIGFKVKKQIDYVPFTNVHHYGLAYTNGVYIPMEQYLEEQNPFVQLYSPYLRKKVLNEELTFLQVQKILNSHFIRLRAGNFEMDLSKLKRKERLYIYDREIEEIDSWYEKLKYVREELMNPSKQLRVWAVNGFHFTSFDNIQKLLEIPGFTSEDVWITSKDSYPQFLEKFNSIAAKVSSRNGIKYYFGLVKNPNNNNQVMKDFCLSINKYFYTKSIGKACEFIVADSCEISPFNKLQKDFQYWTGLRVGDQTLKEYFLKRGKKTFNEIYSLIETTPYKKQFDSLCGITKNKVKEVGWYYHV